MVLGSLVLDWSAARNPIRESIELSSSRAAAALWGFLRTRSRARVRLDVIARRVGLILIGVVLRGGLLSNAIREVLVYRVPHRFDLALEDVPAEKSSIGILEVELQCEARAHKDFSDLELATALYWNLGDDLIRVHINLNQRVLHNVLGIFRYW